MPTPRVVRRRRAVKAGIGILAISLMAAIAARLYWNHTSPASPEKQSGVSHAESEVLNLVNRERMHAGRTPLRFSPRLAVVARGHSYDMAIRRYFSHGSPEGVTPAERVRGVGINYRAVGENIYMDDFRDDEALARRAVAGWMQSIEHREAMLSEKFSESGVGIARSGDGAFYVTQDFVR